MARLAAVTGNASRVGREGYAWPLAGPGASESRGLNQRRWSVSQVATGALLLLFLVGSLVVIDPRRIWRPDTMPVILPAAMATPSTSQPVSTETILDTSVAALPAGRVRVAVDRWRLQPSPTSVTLPAYGGLVQMAVDAGEVIVTLSGGDHRLGPRDDLDVPARSSPSGRRGRRRPSRTSFT